MRREKEQNLQTYINFERSQTYINFEGGQTSINFEVKTDFQISRSLMESHEKVENSVGRVVRAGRFMRDKEMRWFRWR